MSGVLEEVLETLKRIEAKLGEGGVKADAPAPASATEKPRRGRPVGSTTTKPEPPKVETAEAVGGEDSSFLDEEPATNKPTKDDVRAALVAYNKKVNSEQKTRDLLKMHGGVDNLSALPEDKYAAVIKAAKAG